MNWCVELFFTSLFFFAFVICYENVGVNRLLVNEDLDRENEFLAPIEKKLKHNFKYVQEKFYKVRKTKFLSNIF